MQPLMRTGLERRSKALIQSLRRSCQQYKRGPVGWKKPGMIICLSQRLWSSWARAPESYLKSPFVLEPRHLSD